MGKTITAGYITGKINGIEIKSNIVSHPGNYSNDTSRLVRYIVIHYTGNDDDTAIGNAKYFSGNDVDVSAHLFVDETQIYQSVELRDVAWHCGTKKKYYHAKCRNANSIGIEMTTAGKYKVSSKTIENTAYLCAYLCEMLNIKAKDVDTYVLRHYDVTHKKCPAQMVDNVSEWNALKSKIKSILEASEKKTTVSKKETVAESFFPARGYFKKGDTHANVGKIASFMRKVFPSYTSEKALGNYYGDNLIKAVKEFQKRTGLKVDGYFGAETLAKLKSFGFKE